MAFDNFAGNKQSLYAPWSPEHIVEIERHQLLHITETICTDPACRYPQLALRILLHVIAGIDSEGTITIHAGQFAKTLDVNYNTVTKCLKYLRQIDVLCLDHSHR